MLNSKKAYDEIEVKNKELFRLSLCRSKTNNVILIFDRQGNLEWVNEHLQNIWDLLLNEN